MVQGSSATGEKYKPSGTSLPPPRTPFPSVSMGAGADETLEHRALMQLLGSSIEHKGRREDNQPDKRTQQNKFAYGKVDPHEAGHEGGKIGGHAGGIASGKGSAKEQYEEDEPAE
ncbi:uncharacterized protein BDV17DRAFT_221735 [Aspergillus undulatus]|uniref:uncharacterized protein n=1 Tax=Aspergillus undulatus TaxID=1810928 RepID=UPI003CCE15B8